MSVYLRIMVLFLSPLFLGGCGDVNEVLQKYFVTGTGTEGSAGNLTKETVERLSLDVDNELVVIENLDALKDKEFNIDDDPKNVLLVLNYLTTIVRRSELLPETKQSPCQCHYAVSTFRLAVEVMGDYLVKLHKQNLSTLAREDLKKYQQLYRQFSLGKEILEDLSKVDILRLPIAKNSREREEIDEIKKVATEALKKLSSPSSDRSSKSSEEKKEKEE